MSTNADVYYIPGYPEPVPVETVTDLENGSVVNADIQDLQKPTWYRFDVEGNQPVTITFQGPESQYAITHYKKSEDEKGGTGNAHEEKVGNATKYTFDEPGPYEIFFAVASQDQSNWPSSGYTIRMSAGESE